MAAVNPARTPGLGDFVLLQGIASPGWAEVVGASAPRDWDVRKGYGQSGAKVVFTGENVSKFSVKLTFADVAGVQSAADQIDDYLTKFAPLLAKPPAGKAPKALDFYHPMASEDPLNITAVVVTEVGQLTNLGDGRWSVEIKLLQYRAPKPALATPSGAAAKPKAAQQSAPTEADKIIKSLGDQLKGLAA